MYLWKFTWKTSKLFLTNKEIVVSKTTEITEKSLRLQYSRKG